MNWLDIVLLLILAWSIATSFRRGLTREVLGLASVVAALLLALWFYGTAGGVPGAIPEFPFAGEPGGFPGGVRGRHAAGKPGGLRAGQIPSGDGTFDCGPRVGRGFRSIARHAHRGGPDYGDYGLFFGDRPPSSVVRSRFAPYVAGAARVVASIAPHELKDGFRKTHAQAKAAWGRMIENGLQAAPGAQKGKDERKL